ncbi:hypothetical protein CDD83_4320 [Cordyceps sp. RAO-2017]|nr:hypothetical protein CDD83_4320 [Cordyceps sp. RAO-2017]
MAGDAPSRPAHRAHSTQTGTGLPSGKQVRHPNGDRPPPATPLRHHPSHAISLSSTLARFRSSAPSLPASRAARARTTSARWPASRPPQTPLRGAAARWLGPRPAAPFVSASLYRPGRVSARPAHHQDGLSSSALLSPAVLSPLYLRPVSYRRHASSPRSMAVPAGALSLPLISGPAAAGLIAGASALLAGRDWMARGECWLPTDTTAGLVPLDGGEGPATLRVGWGRISRGALRLPAKAEAKAIPFDGGEGSTALPVGCDRMSRGTSGLLVGGGEGPAASAVGRGRISLAAAGAPPPSAPAEAGYLAARLGLC